jgi:hypothetical protein
MPSRNYYFILLVPLGLILLSFGHGAILLFSSSFQTVLFAQDSKSLHMATAWYVASCCGIVVVGAVILLICYLWKRRRMRIAGDQEEYARQLEHWRRSWICLQCNARFVP